MTAELWSAIELSLLVAGSATLFNMLLAGSIGYWLAQTRFAGKHALDALFTLPMVLPPTIIGYLLLVMFGRDSALGQTFEHWFGIRFVFSVPGAIIAAVVVTFPLVLKPARAAFEAVNPELEAAAAVLGLSKRAIFMRVSLPLAWRGLLAGLMLAFARAMGEFGATLMIAGSIPFQTQTLSTAIYTAVQAGDMESAKQLVGVTTAICVSLLLLANLLQRPNPRAMR